MHMPGGICKNAVRVLAVFEAKMVEKYNKGNPGVTSAPGFSLQIN